MADDDGVITGGPGEDATVTDVVLDVTDDGTFRDGSEGKDVTDDEVSFFATVDELASVDALGGNEELVLLLVTEGVTESDLGEWGTATGVMDHVRYNTLEVTVPFTEVKAAEPSWSLPVVRVRLEHRTGTLTLSTDHASHFGCGSNNHLVTSETEMMGREEISIRDFFLV